jgi:hypothetical protein
MKRIPKMNTKSKTLMYLLVAVMLVLQVLPVSARGEVSLSAVQQKTASETAISKYQTAQLNPNLSDVEKIKAVIDAYFVLRYEGMKVLEEQDLSTLLEDIILEWVGKEKDRREVEIFMATLTGLKYQSYQFVLDYDSIEIKGNKAVVQLQESNEVVYETMAPEVTQLAGLQHTFVLHSKRGIWSIYKEEYQDEFSKVFDENSKDQLIEQINKKYKENKKSIFSRGKVMAMPFAVNNSYNRSAALSYSYTYRSYATKNTSYKSMYYQDGYGGDCTNFVSQILYAGAPKMSSNWKYDKKGTSTTNDDTWTNSWSVVGSLGNFLTTNTGIGPYGSVVPVTVTGGYLKSGDVILVSSDGGSYYFHAVSAYQFVNGSLTIVGHDTDRFNYPISNYLLLYTLKFIRIDGWRS